jgi:hypothetical protein
MRKRNYYTSKTWFSATFRSTKPLDIPPLARQTHAKAHVSVQVSSHPFALESSQPLLCQLQCNVALFYPKGKTTHQGNQIEPTRPSCLTLSTRIFARYIIMDGRCSPYELYASLLGNLPLFILFSSDFGFCCDVRGVRQRGTHPRRKSRSLSFT